MPGRYLRRKLGFYLLAAWLATTLNFFLPRFIPGNPVETILARQQSSGQVVPPGEAAALNKLLGLGTGNLLQKYWAYLDSLVHLRLGLSVYEFPVPVATVIGQAIWWTIILVGVATVISFILGTTIGALAGWKRGTWLDAVVPSTTLLTAMPYFWLALILVYLLTELTHLFPTEGGYDPGLAIGFTWAFISSAVRHSLLPAITLLISSVGGWLFGMRNMMVATLSDDYVVAAEAKGLRPSRVMLGYAARNAVLPSVASFAISLGFIVGGQIVMEQVFNYPGIGNVLVQAIGNDDYPLIEGIFLVITVTVLVANLLVDLLYGVIDPRTRLAR